MSSKRTLTALLTLVLMLTAGISAMAAEPKAKAVETEKKSEAVPRLTLVDPLKDFGTVPKGQKLDWTFQIKNTGKADLQLLSVQPACGCTVAEYDKVIKPGATGKVTAHVDTTNFSGPISKAVTIQTNDPNTPTSQLTLTAMVKPFVEAVPAGFVRYNLIQGDAQTQTVTLYTEESEPWEIKSIETPGDYVKATFRKIENPEERVKGGLPAQNQYKIDITLGGPSAPVGVLADKLKIVTNSRQQPEYLLSLTGLIRPTYLVTPSVVNFGEVTPNDESALRRVHLKSNMKDSLGTFKVTRVESSTPAVTVTAAPLQRVEESIDPATNAKKETMIEVPGEFEIQLAIAKSATAGEIDGNIKIHTTDSLNPVYTLPVRGTVKEATKAAN